MFARRQALRDSGLVHALLGLKSTDDLLGHPVVGTSWEGFVIEKLAQAAGPECELSFYRTSGGAEIDLLISWPGGVRWAIEVKRTAAPKVSRGFRSAAEDLRPDRSFVACPIADSFPLGAGVTAIGLAGLVAGRG